MDKIPFVDLKAQYLTIKESIDNAITDTIENTSFIGGKPVKKFEADFASLYGVKHCVSCANGTDAIYIALKMLGIGNGDEVITTACSWISTSETITQAGAKPVFVDIEPDFFTIDPARIEEKITDKTKAIIPVHLYGQVAQIEAIKAIAEKYNLFLIEDCAQSHFSAYDGRRAGTFGNASTFSFYPGKNLGAYGDAGCILTNDDNLAEKMRMYANHGALVKHQHKMEGINSRLDGLQAAILSAKLPYILEWTEKRRQVAKWYDEILADIEEVTIPKVRENSLHSFHLYVIRAQGRNALMQHLAQNGIETAIHYPSPLPFLEAYQQYQYSKQELPVSAAYQTEILSLPVYPELTMEQVQYIGEQVKSFYR
ncbi:DegT/DnrJ/EryC1/StrS family aminotransferase [Pontibacter beigongshangensis]|uniref:DegT/DnrJ/EryC1/StrS family aminotransferase n=1 Tax=Pontibacter beigongshangensis TaxID=2574733 RepID=UPI00164FC787|nr:DegT/DnrJ/EryC1/StrS family aminotransferase [Pontibacter beigongshangensis]